MQNSYEIKKEIERRKAELKEQLARNMEKYHIGTPKQNKEEQNNDSFSKKERAAKEILSNLKRFLDLQNSQLGHPTVQTEAKISSLRKDPKSKNR